MMKTVGLILSILFTAGLGANAQVAKKTQNAIFKTIYVASYQQDCTGVGPMKCLLVKTNPKAKWQLHYNGIDKFNYVAGFEYVLQIKEEKIANPPADASSIKWTLVKVLSKKAAKAPQQALVGTKWTLSNAKVNGKTIDTKGKKGYIQLHKDGKASANGGCNNMGGSYKLKKNRLSFSSFISTMMACPDMSIESALGTALPQVKSYTLKGNTLTLFGNKGTVLVFNFEAEKVTAATEILETKWMLTDIRVANTTTATGDKHPFIILHKDNKMNGNGGCNNMFGAYKIEDGKLSFSGIGMTRMACPDDRNIESSFTKVLDDTFTYSVKNNMLTLTGSKGNALMFKKQ